MEKATKTPLMVLLVITMGEAIHDQEEVIAIISKKVENLQHEMVITKEDILATKEELLVTKEDLQKRDMIISDLKREVSFLKNPPFFHACASLPTLAGFFTQTITYNTLLFSSTNTDIGGMDITSGIFTSPYPGIYLVSWSLEANADLKGAHQVYFYLRKNGQDIQESGLFSANTSPDAVMDIGM